MLVAALAMTAIGCTAAHIVDAGRDAAADDASSLDAGSGAGADTAVDAAVDASDILFADDFEDGTFTDDWILGNGLATQTGGTLVSGTSCMSSVDCSEGPMLLYTRDLFDVGDGRMTIEYDVFTGVNARYENRVIVDLQAEVTGRRISANPDGSTRDIDAVLRGFWHVGGTEPFHTLSTCARCFRTDAVTLERMDFVGADDTWYHFTLSFCGAGGMGMRVTTPAGAVLLDEHSTLLNTTPPPDVTRVYPLLWLEGAGKEIDNLVIRRGC